VLVLVVGVVAWSASGWKHEAPPNSGRASPGQPNSSDDKASASDQRAAASRSTGSDPRHTLAQVAADIARLDIMRGENSRYWTAQQTILKHSVDDEMSKKETIQQAIRTATGALRVAEEQLPLLTAQRQRAESQVKDIQRDLATTTDRITTKKDELGKTSGDQRRTELANEILALSAASGKKRKELDSATSAIASLDNSIRAFQGTKESLPKEISRQQVAMSDANAHHIQLSRDIASFAQLDGDSLAVLRQLRTQYERLVISPSESDVKAAQSAIAAEMSVQRRVNEKLRQAILKRLKPQYADAYPTLIDGLKKLEKVGSPSAPLPTPVDWHSAYLEAYSPVNEKLKAMKALTDVPETDAAFLGDNWMVIVNADSALAARVGIAIELHGAAMEILGNLADRGLPGQDPAIVGLVGQLVRRAHDYRVSAEEQCSMMKQMCDHGSFEDIGGELMRAKLDANADTIASAAAIIMEELGKAPARIPSRMTYEPPARVQQPIGGPVRMIVCPRCGGTGMKSQAEISSEASRFGPGSGAHKIDMKCPQCRGTGQVAG
jgi:hypothetical protein